MTPPGLQKKLNIPQTSTSLRSSASAAISVSERSTTVSSTRSGTSYGILAQRTDKGKGLIFNAREYNNPYIAQQRRELNENRTPSYLYTDFTLPQSCNCSTDNSMNKYAEAMSALNTLTGLGTQIADAVKSTKGSETASENEFNGVNISKCTNLTDLKNKTKLSDINTLETSMKNSLKDFQQNYSRDVQTNMEALSKFLNEGEPNGIKDGLTCAGVNLDTSSLGARVLSIDTENLASLDVGIDNINQDIADVDKFITTNLANATSALGTKINSLQASIVSLEAQIGASPEPTNKSDLQSQLAELKKQLEQCEAAKKSLSEGGDFRKAVDAIKTTLIEKRDALGDIQLTLSQVADKKYEVAKENDEALTKLVNKQNRLNRKITQLNGKINSASGGKKTRLQAELKEVQTELASILEQMIPLVENLKIDGAQQNEFTNSKGQTYTIKNSSFLSDPNTISTWQAEINKLKPTQQNAESGSGGGLSA